MNSLPFIMAIEKMKETQNVELINIVPSETIDLFRNNLCDIALVPVGGLSEIKDYQIISDYCISCDGAVDSVGLFSNVPIDEIDHIYLDNHSRTSNNLCKILVKEYWKRNCSYSKASVEGKELKSNEGKIMIGDKAIKGKKDSKYYYDFGEIWQMKTGMPFVFAVWIAKKDISEDLKSSFNSYLKVAFDNLDLIINKLEHSFPKEKNIRTYLTSHIKYDLTSEKKKSMNTFIQRVNSIKENERISSYS